MSMYEVDAIDPTEIILNWQEKNNIIREKMHFKETAHSLSYISFSFLLFTIALQFSLVIFFLLYKYIWTI